jgi:hypothetical protein
VGALAQARTLFVGCADVCSLFYRLILRLCQQLIWMHMRQICG